MNKIFVARGPDGLLDNDEQLQHVATTLALATDPSLFECGVSYSELT